MKILDCEVCHIARLSPQFPTIQHREQEYPVLPTAFLFSVSYLPVLPVWPLFPLTDTAKQPSIEFVCPDCFLSLSCPVLEDWRNGSTVEIRTDSLALWVGLIVGTVHLLGSWKGQNTQAHSSVKGSWTPPAPFKCKGHSLQRQWASGVRLPPPDTKMQRKLLPTMQRPPPLSLWSLYPYSVLFTHCCAESA